MPEAIPVARVGHGRAQTVDQGSTADHNGHTGSLGVLIKLAIFRQESIPIHEVADRNPKQPWTKFRQSLAKGRHRSMRAKIDRTPASVKQDHLRQEVRQNVVNSGLPPTARGRSRSA